jgi:carbamate kinase
MGPKVLAACEFVEKTGRRAVIGSMTDTPALLAGTAGTSISNDASGLELGAPQLIPPDRTGPKESPRWQ